MEAVSPPRTQELSHGRAFSLDSTRVPGPRPAPKGSSEAPGNPAPPPGSGVSPLSFKVEGSFVFCPWICAVSESDCDGSTPQRRGRIPFEAQRKTPPDGPVVLEDLDDGRPDYVEPSVISSSSRSKAAPSGRQRSTLPSDRGMHRLSGDPQSTQWARRPIRSEIQMSAATTSGNELYNSCGQPSSQETSPKHFRSIGPLHGFHPGQDDELLYKKRPSTGCQERQPDIAYQCPCQHTAEQHERLQHGRQDRPCKCRRLLQDFQNPVH